MAGLATEKLFSSKAYTTFLAQVNRGEFVDAAKSYNEIVRVSERQRGASNLVSSLKSQWETLPEGDSAALDRLTQHSALLESVPQAKEEAAEILEQVRRGVAR